jgi:hypothetical protein
MLLSFLHKKGVGFSGMTFGVMDGVLTVLSVLIGLGSVADKYAVFSAMIIVGLADAMANAAGIRVSQETVVHLTKKHVFMSMLFAFLGTFVAVISLVIPLIFFSLETTVIVSTVIGMIFLCGLGAFVGIRRMYDRKDTLRLISEYVITGMVIIAISYTLGIVFQNPWVVLWLQN